MSKIKILTIAVIGLLIVNVALVAAIMFKKPPMPPKGPPPMGQDRGPGMKEDGPKKIIIVRLGFDKQQINAYEKLIDAHQASVKKLDDSIKMAKNNMYQSLQTENFAGKDSLVNKLGALQKQIELTHYQHFADLKKICRPDQLARFNDLTKELARFFAPGKKNPPPPKD